MLGSRAPLHVFDADTVKAYCYRDEAQEAYVRMFLGTVILGFMSMDNSAKLYTIHIVDAFLKEESIRRRIGP